VYASAKVAQDLSASKVSMDHEQAIRAGIRNGKNFARQLWEYFQLTRGPGRLKLMDYYLYELYDDSKYTFAQKQEFVSDRYYFDIVGKCCDRRWWILADDKFWSYTVLQANGFPVPDTQAVYCAAGRVFGGVPTLSNTEQLTGFLSEEAAYPIYSKPVNGIGSFGNFLITGYDEGSLRLHDNSLLPLEQFVAEIDATNGQLLQSTLKPHEDLADVGERVSTVRVILIVRQGEPKILHTVWKIPADENIADNFWRAGNRLASIKVETGEVERVVAHLDGAAKTVDQDSPGAAGLLGRKLPDWQNVIDICTRGAKLFSPLKFQSWDIALSDGGPVVVELNPGSAFNLSQHASGRGFLTDEFLTFLSECGCKLKKRRSPRTMARV
jgi:hypothetical protein